MSAINRIETDEFWADSTIIEAGDYAFVGYCMGNEGKTIEEQIHGAIDTLENRLKMIGLSLESVVKMDCLFKDINDLNYLPEALKDRFAGKYPVRKHLHLDLFVKEFVFKLMLLLIEIPGFAIRSKRHICK